MSRRITRRITRRREDSGSATIFVVGMAVTLMVSAGLVLDGGTALNGRMRLADEVEQAARAGAQQIDLTVLRSTGQVVLDEPAARARAADYLREVGRLDSAITVQNGQISVTSRDSVDTVLLGLIGINTFEIRASATSEAVTR